MPEIANAGVAAAPAERLWAFAVRLRRRHVRRAAEAMALRAALLVTGPALAVAFGWPALQPAALTAALLVVLAVAVAAALRARSVADAALFAGDDPTTALEPIGDELATWLELHRRRRGDTPMGQWLSHDVDARLPRLPAGALAHVGRRRLGRWRWLVPLVLVLVLAWLILQWMTPPWPGAVGGGGSGAGTGGVGGGAGPAHAGAGDAAPDATEPTVSPPDPSPPDAAPPPAQPSPPTADDPSPTPEPEAPAPLLDLPEQQRFVVPEFVGDGPSRRVRMHAAELAQGGGAVRAAGGSTGGGEGEAPAAPPPTRATFERAAEAAQRARHVPDEERPIVRRFFERLREAAR